MAPLDVLRESPEPMDSSRDSLEEIMLRIGRWVSILSLVTQDGSEGRRGQRDQTEVMTWFWRVCPSYLIHWTWKRHWNREEERDSEGGGEKE